MRIPLPFSKLLVIELRGRCRHNVVGICPRCYPAESRTLRNLKLCLAIAWLERMSVRDPIIDPNPAQLRAMAKHALKTVAEAQQTLTQSGIEWPR